MWSGVRSTDWHFGGAGWYFEVTCNVQVGGSGACIGIANGACSLADYPGAGVNGCSMHVVNGVFNYNTGTVITENGLAGFQVPTVAGDVWGVHVIGDQYIIRFAKVSNLTYGQEPVWSRWLPFNSANNNLFNSFYAIITPYRLTDQYTANFGASPFRIPRMPDEAKSWDGTQSWRDPMVLEADLPEPPKPPPPDVRLTNPDGTPTKAYHDFLTKQYEFERKIKGY